MDGLPVFQAKLGSENNSTQPKANFSGHLNCLCHVALRCIRQTQTEHRDRWMDGRMDGRKEGQLVFKTSKYNPKGSCLGTVSEIGSQILNYWCSCLM